MANIKGENLRLFMDERAVAAATNANVHIQLNVGESDTKDDVAGWIVNEPLGHLWDAQVDAMVLDGGNTQGSLVEEGEVVCDTLRSGIYYANHIIHLERNQKLKLFIPGSSANQSIISVLNEDFTTAASTGTPAQFLDYTAQSDRNVYISTSDANRTVKFAVLDLAATIESFIDYINQDGLVEVKFAHTYDGHSQNRDISSVLFEGTAWVQDLNIVAQNQEVTTYSCKLVGTGPLVISNS